MPDITDADIDNVARTAISEAGEYGDAGMASVVQVARNRWLAGGFGDTPSAVVLAPKQFSAWGLNKKDPNYPNNIPANDPRLAHVKQIVQGVFGGQVPDATNGATFYWDPSARHSAPDFAQGRKPIARVGGHLFYTDPDGGHVPDLLSEWSTRPATGMPANQPQSAPQAPAGDLLGEWATQPETPPPAAPATPEVPWQRPDLPHLVVPSPNAPMPGTAAATPAATAAAQPETVPQTLQRWANETPGEFIANRLASVQGPGPLNALGRGALGVARGIMDVPATLAKGAAAVGNELGATDWAAGVNARVARDMAAFAPYDTGLAAGGRLAGQVVGTAPFLGMGGAALDATGALAPLAGRPVLNALATGIGTGAGTAALTSAASDQPFFDQVGGGALTGGILGPAGYGLGRAGSAIVGRVAGVTPEAAQLAAQARDVYDIPLTAGQIAQSNRFKTFESVLRNLPFSGFGKQEEAVRSAFNREVGATFGENTDKLSKNTIRAAKTRIGGVFNSVAAQTPTILADPPFLNTLNQVERDSKKVLQSGEFAPLKEQLREINNKIDPVTGGFGGDIYQALTRKEAPLSRLQQSRDPNIKFYANKIRNALDSALQRSAPSDVVDDLKTARAQWHAMKTVEPIVNPKKAPLGNVSPLLLGGRQTSNDDLNALSEIGQAFVKQPPDSHTAQRQFWINALGGLGAGAAGFGGSEFDPDNANKYLGLAGGALLAGPLAGRFLRGKMLTNALIRSGLPGYGQKPANLLLGAAAPGALLERNMTDRISRQ